MEGEDNKTSEAETTPRVPRDGRAYRWQSNRSRPARLPSWSPARSRTSSWPISSCSFERRFSVITPNAGTPSSGHRRLARDARGAPPGDKILSIDGVVMTTGNATIGASTAAGKPSRRSHAVRRLSATTPAACPVAVPNLGPSGSASPVVRTRGFGTWRGWKCVRRCRRPGGASLYATATHFTQYVGRSAVDRDGTDGGNAARPGGASTRFAAPIRSRSASSTCYCRRSMAAVRLHRRRDDLAKPVDPEHGPSSTSPVSR